MEENNKEDIHSSTSSATDQAARPHILELGPDTSVRKSLPPDGTANHEADTPSRRAFLIGAAGTSAALALAPLLLEEGTADAQTLTGASGSPASGTVNITLNINNVDYPLVLEPRVTLLDTLRERLHLTGTKKGCDHGQCGACTVHVDGKRINSCLTLAIMQQNRKITTIEGLATGESLHPMQTAFIEHDGFQCGYCTPGQIMSAVAVIKEGHAHTEADIREQMSGNICRCGAYPNIVAAIQAVMDGKMNTDKIGNKDGKASVSSAEGSR